MTDKQEDGTRPIHLTGDDVAKLHEQLGIKETVDPPIVPHDKSNDVQMDLKPKMDQIRANQREHDNAVKNHDPQFDVQLDLPKPKKGLLKILKDNVQKGLDVLGFRTGKTH